MTQAPSPPPVLKRVARVAQKAAQPVVVGPIRTELLDSAHPLPLLAQPEDAGLDLAAWAGENREWIDARLLEHGGILFRNFRIGGLAEFQRFVEGASGDLLEYRYRSTPRTEVSGKIYTSTEYPASEEIPLHNENSYSRTWPLKIFFFCEKNAREGGMTPIADSHEVYRRVPAALRDRFAEKGVMYVRNYGEGADLSWREVFQTDDRTGVEEFCRQAGIEHEWKPDGGLRTRQVCQAVADHPRKGLKLWFNQAHLFHISSLAPGIREAMLEVFAEEDLPRNTYYGDGTPIDVADLDTIRQIYRDVQISFPWQEGDILLLDNMGVAHGRTPYKGERKIRVGMTELVEGARP
jgi:alpha-ketoglutarate-dependent taurine dioxygenase